MAHNGEKHDEPQIPLSEKLKGVAGFFGIRVGEEPLYSVKEAEGDFEIRTYHSYLIAQTKVSGAHKPAQETAFHRLADYIFGANVLEEKMAMTAPVFTEETNSDLTMTFTLPSQFNLQTAPRPLDCSIQIAENPPEIVAVLQYSGINSEEKSAQKVEELLQWIARRAEYSVNSQARVAQYDAPFTIPFMRKNEIHITLRPAH